MGIDIYARYSGQPHKEIVRQGDAYHGGAAGYLREAYHGERYATLFLVPEAFDFDGAAIPAATLRKRLPEARRLAELREKLVHSETDKKAIEAVKDNYTAFVEFCERVERETGTPVTIFASY